MRKFNVLMASCALGVLGTASAQADCAEDLAAMTGEGGVAAEESISKDGSLAPLETEGGNDTTTAAPPAQNTGDEGTSGSSAESGGDGIIKDGSQEPLESSDTGDTTDQAMSAQDAEAQQGGEETAAEESSTAESGGAADRDALIERARTALAAGDEEACRNALEEAAAI